VPGDAQVAELEPQALVELGDHLRGFVDRSGRASRLGSAGPALELADPLRELRKFHALEAMVTDLGRQKLDHDSPSALLRRDHGFGALLGLLAPLLIVRAVFSISVTPTTTHCPSARSRSTPQPRLPAPFGCDW
jgi:hypothetical protein